MREKRTINFDDSLLLSSSSILVLSALIKRPIFSLIMMSAFLRYQTQPALSGIPCRSRGGRALIETH